MIIKAYVSMLVLSYTFSSSNSSLFLITFYSSTWADVNVFVIVLMLQIHMKSNNILEAENVQRKLLHIMELSKVHFLFIYLYISPIFYVLVFARNAQVCLFLFDVKFVLLSLITSRSLSFFLGQFYVLI